MHRERLREAGFGSHTDCLLIMAMMGMAIAVLGAEIIRRTYRGGEARSARCVGNLLEIVDGADPAALTCPITGDAYALRKSESGDRIACPDPENHLGFAVHLVREGVGWALRVDLPTPPPPDSAGRLALERWALAIAPNDVRIETALAPLLVRFVVFLFVGLFVGGIFFLPLYWMLSSPSVDDTRGVMFFVILCTGLLTMAVLARNFARSEEIVLQGETRLIRIQARHFGLELTTTETLESVRGVYPASFHGRVGAVAIYESEGALSYRVLMESSAQNASGLSHLSSIFHQ